MFFWRRVCSLIGFRFTFSAKNQQITWILWSALLKKQDNFGELIHFQPIFHYIPPWEYHKIGGFLIFSRGIEVEHWLKMSWLCLIFDVGLFVSFSHLFICFVYFSLCFSLIINPDHPVKRISLNASSDQKFVEAPNPAGIYLLKVNNINTRTRCEICSKLTIKTPEQRWRRSGVFTDNFEHISHLVLFPLLTLNM